MVFFSSFCILVLLVVSSVVSDIILEGPDRLAILASLASDAYDPYPDAEVYHSYQGTCYSFDRQALVSSLSTSIFTTGLHKMHSYCSLVTL